MIRVSALVTDDSLDVCHLPEHIRNASSQLGIDSELPEDLTIESVLRKHIERVLSLAGNNQTHAARMLGVPLSTFRSKMKRLGVTNNSLGLVTK
jgi:DNA-binding NtrC family response regulator